MTFTQKNPTELLNLPGCKIVKAGESKKSNKAQAFEKWQIETNENNESLLVANRPQILECDYAILMYSVPIICIDIDGKNEGFKTWQDELSLLLPPTLTETSKSGNGYHLFYSVPQDTHDKMIEAIKVKKLKRDIVGYRTGIDIKFYGCVYHFNSAGQMANELPIAPLPRPILHDILRLASQREYTNKKKTVMINKETGDALELSMECGYYCTRPISVGEQDNTLLSYGVALKREGNILWADHLRHAMRVSKYDADDPRAFKQGYERLCKQVENYVQE